MMLGFALSWFVVHLSQGEQRVMAPMTAVWILGLPLMDTVTVMLRRIRARQSPFNPDRQHLHHLLLSRGLSDGQVTARMLALSAASGALGVGAWWIGIPESVQFYAFLAAFVIYYRLTSRIWTRLCQERDAASGLDRRRLAVTPVSASMSDFSGGNLVTEQK
jgi:UDP-GlcNAc:undecaprenyl-phosphate GlcNAc-1-phosphate transferase